MFSYGLERKEAFEDDKNVNFFKSKKIGIFERGSPMVSVKKSAILSSVFSVFSKGVHPWFGSKAIRPCCFLWLAAIYSFSNSHTLIPFNVAPMS